MFKLINVTIWNEGRHERESESVAKVYPKGIHGCIADFLGTDEELNITTATLDDADNGLPESVLENTEVLIWWGHMAHECVPDDLVERVYNRVMRGMGFIALHSAHFSKPFTRTYRMAIDDYKKSQEYYQSRIPFYKSEIAKCTYRQYTTGFFFGKPDENTQIYDSNTYVKEYTYLGIIGGKNDKGYRIEQRNKFSVGEAIEVMKPDGSNIEAVVKGIYDQEGNAQESAPHPKQVLYVDLGMELDEFDILRRGETTEIA